jgi:ketosteroid isomerase-like protein
MEASAVGPRRVVEDLLAAVNAHDLDGMFACFADDYVNETPAHPQRSFHGADQVRTNWARIFAGAPDIRAAIPRMAVDGETVWTEWELEGTRPDRSLLQMRGVVVFVVDDRTIRSARFYLEPVEHDSGDVDAHTRRITDSTSTDRTVS